MEMAIQARIKLDDGKEIEEDIFIEETLNDDISITIPSLEGYVTVELKDLTDAIRIAVLKGKGLI